MWEKPEPYKGTTINDRGYEYFYAPSHPLSRSNGLVSLARHNASVALGKWISSNLVVVFDGNMVDGQPELITRRDLLSRNNAAQLGRSVSFQCERQGCREERTEGISHYLRHLHHYCSPECNQMASRKFEVSERALRLLVWMVPTLYVAEIFGVSDKAIEKRCKKFGIEKPERGYWQKHAAAEWAEVTALLAIEGIE